MGPGCLVSSGVICRTCGEACPSLAIHFPLKVGSPSAPEINAEACSGCGQCVAPCPTSAISVEGRAPSRPS